MDSDDDVDYDALFDVALNSDAVKMAMDTTSVMGATPLKVHVISQENNPHHTPTAMENFDARDPKRRRLSTTPSAGDASDDVTTPARAMHVIEEENGGIKGNHTNSQEEPRRKTATTRELIPDSSSYGEIQTDEDVVDVVADTASTTNATNTVGDTDTDTISSSKTSSHVVKELSANTNTDTNTDTITNTNTNSENDLAISTTNTPVESVSDSEKVTNNEGTPQPRQSGTPSRNQSTSSATSVETVDLNSNDDHMVETSSSSTTSTTSPSSTTPTTTTSPSSLSPSSTSPSSPSASTSPKVKAEEVATTTNNITTLTTTQAKDTPTPAQEPKKRAQPKCTSCNKADGTIIAPMGPKRRMFLCVGCAKTKLFCVKCNATANKKPKTEIERCQVCGWLNCPKGECFGACTGCDSALRPLQWKQCGLTKCQQSWAETNKWCSTCGSCALKSCTSKFQSCKLPTCKKGTMPNPCVRTAIQGTGGLAAKHYHCVDCRTTATKALNCACCNKFCSCKKCGSCNTGSCCNPKTQKCTLKGCNTDVCRRCASKTKTGKYSGLCAEHYGSRATLTTRKSQNESSDADDQQTQTQTQRPEEPLIPAMTKNKRRKCCVCDGTEREHHNFKTVNGNLYCAPCSKSS